MPLKALFCSGPRQKPGAIEEMAREESVASNGDDSSNTPSGDMNMSTDTGFTRSITGDILMQRGFTEELGQQSLGGCSAEGNQLAPNTSYGGNFTWVEAVYKMKVKVGIHPLAIMNGLTKRLMVMQNLVLMEDGSFRRPHENTSMFPVKGVSLWWRWEEETERIIIDFYSDGKRMPWRWDELRPSGPRFPSTIPDLIGIGHVGKFTFEYSFLSVQAEEGAQPSTLSVMDKEMARLLDSPLIREPRGEFGAGDLLTTADAAGAFDGFARAFSDDIFAGSILCLCPGLEAPKVINAGILREGGSVTEFLRSFAEQLEDAALQGAPEGTTLPSREAFETVARRAALAMNDAVGSAFASSRQLAPEFLQPRHIIISLGRPLEFRLLTYAFVGDTPSKVQGKLGDRSTPFVARLLSPVLSSDQCTGDNFRYVVSVTKESTTAQFQRRDMVLVLKAVAAGQWSRLF